MKTMDMKDLRMETYRKYPKALCLRRFSECKRISKQLKRIESVLGFSPDTRQQDDMKVFFSPSHNIAYFPSQYLKNPELFMGQIYDPNRPLFYNPEIIKDNLVTPNIEKVVCPVKAYYPFYRLEIADKKFFVRKEDFDSIWHVLHRLKERKPEIKMKKSGELLLIEGKRFSATTFFKTEKELEDTNFKEIAIPDFDRIKRRFHYKKDEKVCNRIIQMEGKGNV